MNSYASIGYNKMLTAVGARRAEKTMRRVKLQDNQAAEAAEWTARAVHEAGGRALLVGGCVRDAHLGRAAKDADMEAFGVDPRRLIELLKTRFSVDLVGEAFCVVKIRGLPLDVSVPRRESKSGLGHKGFTATADPTLSFEEAASRRDFTMNAMGFDLLTGEVLDPFGGGGDLDRRILRHVSYRFAEDPLRVLRGAQFAARFRLNADPSTIQLCRSMTMEGLAKERIFDEWKKLILLGGRPSMGLDFLRRVGWTRYFPELEALIDTPQDPEWHPEGDVWTHTLHCMDAFAKERIGCEREDLVVGLGVLCHDFGKPASTVFERGRWRSPGHDVQGEKLTRRFVQRLSNQKGLAKEAAALTRWHMVPAQLEPGVSDAAVRRLSRRAGRLDRLLRVCAADMNGRPPLPKTGQTELAWLKKRAAELNALDSQPNPILLGRHAIQELDMEPGPKIGHLLKEAYEAQLDGAFDTLETGLEWLRAKGRLEQ